MTQLDIFAVQARKAAEVRAPAVASGGASVASFTKHPLWPAVRPFLLAKRAAPDTRGPRVRIEVVGLPPELVEPALQAVSPCVACGRPMHPIRERAGPIKRGPTRGATGLYFAAACPLSVNVSCSRGAPARDEYLAVEAALR